MDINVPHPERRRALVVVDMQPSFVREQDAWLVDNVQRLIRDGGYATVVEANFHAGEGTVWDRQLGATFPRETTVDELGEQLEGATKVEKQTKSAFKGDKDLAPKLRAKGIEEVHVVGADTHDCVLATAQEAFDLGFEAYVIEECTASSAGEHLRDAALVILRELQMTNRAAHLREER